MENKFKKGLILGGLLAVGAAVGFAMTKEGQDLTEELKKDLAGLAKKLQKQLHHLEDVSKDKFDELVGLAVDEYSAKKEMAEDMKKIFVTSLQNMWHDMEAEYNSSKEDKA